MLKINVNNKEIVKMFENFLYYNCLLTTPFSHFILSKNILKIVNCTIVC